MHDASTFQREFARAWWLGKTLRTESLVELFPFPLSVTAAKYIINVFQRSSASGLSTLIINRLASAICRTTRPKKNTLSGSVSSHAFCLHPSPIKRNQPLMTSFPLSLCTEQPTDLWVRGDETENSLCSPLRIFKFWVIYLWQLTSSPARRFRGKEMIEQKRTR